MSTGPNVEVLHKRVARRWSAGSRFRADADCLRHRSLARAESYAAAEGVNDGGARTGRAGRAGRGRDARSVSRTASPAITVWSTSRSTLRPTTAVAAITATTTSSRSAPSYMPRTHSGSGGLASARGKIAKRRTGRPRTHTVLHRPPTWARRASKDPPRIIQVTNSAPSATGLGQCKGKEIAATLRLHTVGVKGILPLLGHERQETCILYYPVDGAPSASEMRA